MSNKITGSDLERLLKEAMGLRQENPRDIDMSDSELADQLIDTSPVEDPQDDEGTMEEPPEDKVPGVYLFYPPWNTKEPLKDYNENLYSDEHKDAIKILTKIANSTYYGESGGVPTAAFDNLSTFKVGFLNDDKIFDFLSSGDEKRREILGLSNDQGVTKQVNKIKKYLLWMTKQPDNKISRSQKSMALSLATKDPKDFAKKDSQNISRPNISFDKSFSEKGRINTIPRHIKSVFDSVISIDNSVNGRIQKLSEISAGLIKSSPKTTDFANNNMSTNQNFSSLVTLDFLRQIAAFSRDAPKEAGNYFESFLALLLNGTVEGGKYDLEDVLLPFEGKANGTTEDGPAYISAKLISKLSYVTQSGATVKKFFKVHGEKAKIRYILAEKDFYSRNDQLTLTIYVKDFTYDEVENASEQTPGIEPDSTNKPVYFYPPTKKGTIPPRPQTKGGSAKPIASTGTYIFNLRGYGRGKPVGTITFARNDEVYAEKMEQKFEALKGGISDMYANLNNLEENLTIFYSSPTGDSKKETAANAAEKNIDNIEKNYNEFIAPDSSKDDDTIGGDSQGDAMVKLGQDSNARRKQRPVSNDAATDKNKVTLEHKVNSVDIKKLIEESFKK